MSSFSAQSGSVLPSGPAHRLNDAFVIEVGEMPAGILVRQGDRYRFFAADRDFGLLEGSFFRTPAAARNAAERMQAATRPIPAPTRRVFR